jgi:hypothetical protein
LPKASSGAYVVPILLCHQNKIFMTPTQTLPPQDNQIDDKSTSYGSLMIFILIVALAITTSMSRRQHHLSQNAEAAPVEHVEQKAVKSSLGTAENPVALDEVVYSVPRP